MNSTPETLKAIHVILNRLTGTFGGGYKFEPEYLREMGATLLAECPTMTVFRAVERDLLGMDPTGPDGRRYVPTAQDVRRLAREHTPADKREECSSCKGSGWVSRRRSTRNPCGIGRYEIDVAERCSCGTVYRPPKEPDNATMADVAGLVADGGGR